MTVLNAMRTSYNNKKTPETKKARSRHRRRKREEIQHVKGRGLLIQFAIFLILRTIDLAASIAVLENAWEQSFHWDTLNDKLFNTTQHMTRSINPRSIHYRKSLPRRIFDLLQQNDSPRNFGSLRRFQPQIKHLEMLDSRERESLRNKLASMKRRSITDEQQTTGCENIKKFTKRKVESNISHYNFILRLTIFFTIISLIVFLTHLGFWIATLKITFREGLDYQTRVTELTRNHLLSLATALFRDVPLSCLNVELLALRSGRGGLACIACLFANKCPPQDYVETSLDIAKSLLIFNYFVMFINCTWKGVAGFYRLSRFKDFNVYIIRACASIVFAILYCAFTFTPAMYMVLYRYFTIPGLNAAFIQEMAKNIVVVGTSIWVVIGASAVCCPILYAIRLNAD